MDGERKAVASGHPRLYLTAGELPRLRALRSEGLHARIWSNLKDSADWCLTRTPRRAWIAPVPDDPIYLNLYNRFYAIMGDLAITEHLAFAYALSGDAEYGEAARRWVMSSCRLWRNEAEQSPDGAKAYAVSRMLKGVAVGYDLAFDRLTEAERSEIRAVLKDVGQLYFSSYFSTPSIAGPDFHAHHAIVEFGSFGVAALAVLGEVAQASAWLAATVRKFEEHLLPLGLAPDGAQVEGATFWASTMHYRLFFMDALRRVTGLDLFGPYQRNLNADLALASIAACNHPGWNEDHRSVVLSPSYGQLDYFAPVLLYLAREYRHPIHQYLALWDHSLGHIQRTRYMTPDGEQLLFELGGYSYLWYDPILSPAAGHPRLSHHFPSVNEAYARTSWQPGGLLVGMGKQGAVIHAGGQPVLIELSEGKEAGQSTVEDDGQVATIRRAGGDSGLDDQVVALNRPSLLALRRRTAEPLRWWCQGSPRRDGNTLTWPDGTNLVVTKGTIASVELAGYGSDKIVGMGKLRCPDPAPMKHPLVVSQPHDGEIELEVHAGRSQEGAT